MITRVPTLRLQQPLACTKKKWTPSVRGWTSASPNSSTDTPKVLFSRLQQQKPRRLSLTKRIIQKIDLDIVHVCTKRKLWMYMPKGCSDFNTCVIFSCFLRPRCNGKPQGIMRREPNWVLNAKPSGQLDLYSTHFWPRGQFSLCQSVLLAIRNCWSSIICWKDLGGGLCVFNSTYLDYKVGLWILTCLIVGLPAFEYRWWSPLPLSFTLLWK